MTSAKPVCDDEKLSLRKARRSLCDPRQTDDKGRTPQPHDPWGAVQLMSETIPRLTQIQFVINGAVETGSKTDHQVHTRDGLHISSRQTRCQAARSKLFSVTQTCGCLNVRIPTKGHSLKCVYTPKCWGVPHAVCSPLSGRPISFIAAFPPLPCRLTRGDMTSMMAREVSRTSRYEVTPQLKLQQH